MPDTKLPLTPRALLEIKAPHSPDLSPDGKRVVFVVNEPDFEESRWVGRLWMADVPEGRARRITHSYEGERGPRWSPDGQNIAFLSSRPDMTEPPPEDEQEEDLHKEQVWVLPADGGEAYRLTNAKEGVRGFEWTPDGKTVIYLAPEPRPQPIQFVRDTARKKRVDPVVEHQEKLRQQFWEVDLEEKKPELLYTGDYGVTEFVVSPDGQKILFNSNETGEPNDYYRYELFILDIESGETSKPVRREGAKFQPQWSPEGERIAFLANLDPHLSYSQECVWEAPASGGEPANLFANVPYDCHEIHWARGDCGLLGLVADHTAGPLARISRDAVRLIVPPDTSGEAGRSLDCTGMHANEHGTVVVIEDDCAPPELYAINLDGERTALTELNKGFAERYELPRQEVIRWNSTEGFEIEGVLIHPPGELDRAAPMIVMVHGGPKGRATNTLRSYHLHPLWATDGYLVLRPNFRGSEGYGNAFAVANRRDLGGGDFRDITAGIDHVIARGLADPERIGITGGSYGGYMTNWAIGQTDRFAAAVSMFGIFNLVTDYSNSEIPRWDPDYMGAYYWEDPEIYRRCSPATYLENVKTPVLIIHGESDNNTFIANSKEMYQALRARGATVEFVHYPREGHGLHEPNHRLDEIRRSLAWMDRYLKGAGAQPVYRIGDRIEHEGYELIVGRAEDADYANWHEDWGRLLEVAFSVASKDPVDSAWRFELTDVALTHSDGSACDLRGVPVDSGGARMVVAGEGLAADIHPDKETGRISLGLAAAYQIPREGGRFELRIGDFPPVTFAMGEKEEKPEEDPEHPAHGREEFAESTPEDPGPIQTPQRPKP